MKSSREIRKKFLHYFQKEGHLIVPSSPVAPLDDPTLLFTNAGMNQFKDVFLGKSKRDTKRATTSQKCIRAGGKHNDLENVGHTRRHLTFFEMLGNFSFGDYFKSQAIQFAFQVATEVFGFEKGRIWATVYRDDDEAYELWSGYLPKERIVRFGEKDNFWAMGETGPCGPCSELLYDRGPDYGDDLIPEEDSNSERFLEFWNLVFMQYNRQPNGEMQKLPNPSIDTGAGLERVMSLIQDVDSVYETDILRNLIQEIEKVVGCSYNDHHNRAAFRVIADHIRSLSFAIADGAQPSNLDRGYVLRKILRRAVRYGRQLGMNEPFLAKILPRLIAEMGEEYPELKKNESRIAEIFTVEEESFLRTLKRGGNLLQQIVERSQLAGNQISGEDAFKLKDTYGLPIDEIVLLAKDAGLGVDLERFQEQEEEARERSRKVHKGATQIAEVNLFADLPPTKFLGYEKEEATAKVVALFKEGKPVTELQAGNEGVVVLDQTPFYAEMGGQVGDTGVLKSSQWQFTVADTKSPFKGVTAHIGKVEKGAIKVGDSTTAGIDAERRGAIACNHTATHLLHYALHEVLGEHVRQAGSVVEPNRLRFDFSHHKALTATEIRHIEDLVNKLIRENRAVTTKEVAYEEARKQPDIKQFFGDKYDQMVRVVEVNPSKELCGGIHTTASGTIGYFRILEEKSIAAGVRRIEAVTGEKAESYSREQEDALLEMADLLKTTPKKLLERTKKLLDEKEELEKAIKNNEGQARRQIVETLLKEKEQIGTISLIAKQIQMKPGELRQTAEELMQGLKSGVVAIALASDGKAHLLIHISPDLVATNVQANRLIQELAPLIEGTGGGKAEMAQAGGKRPESLPLALLKLRELLASH